MTEPWVDARLVYLMLHILGTALGAGSAFTGDFIFLTSVRNKKITPSELRIMSLSSKIVWVGVLILLLSGIGLVEERPDIFLHSQKFWSKMSVVGIIITNGLLFHFLHIPAIKQSVGKAFTATLPIITRRTWLSISGALSFISWNFVIILGVLGRTPFTYLQFLTTYLLCVLVAVGGAIVLRSRLIPTAK